MICTSINENKLESLGVRGVHDSDFAEKFYWTEPDFLSQSF